MPHGLVILGRIISGLFDFVKGPRFLRIIVSNLQKSLVL